MALRALLGKEVGVKIQHEKFFDFIKAKNSCWPAVMFNLRLKLHEIDEFTHVVTEGIKSGIFPPSLITKLKDQGNEVLSALENRDFKVGHWTVMQHDLKDLEDLNTSEKHKIIRVQTEKHLSHWMRICETELMQGKMDKRLFSSKLADENVHLFLGYDHDTPVSTSLIYFEKKESGLYLVATSDEFRGKGFGKAITQHALHQAKKRDCSFMNLEATDLGLPVYKGLGFNNHGPVSLINFAKKANED